MPRQSITKQDLEVGALVAQGLRDGEIADRLGIHATTVKYHRGRVRRAIGTHSCVEVARWFWEREDEVDRLHIRDPEGLLAVFQYLDTNQPVRLD